MSDVKDGDFVGVNISEDVEKVAWLVNNLAKLNIASVDEKREAVEFAGELAAAGTYVDDAENLEHLIFKLRGIQKEVACRIAEFYTSGEIKEREELTYMDWVELCRIADSNHMKTLQQYLVRCLKFFLVVRPDELWVMYDDAHRRRTHSVRTACQKVLADRAEEMLEHSRFSSKVVTELPFLDFLDLPEMNIKSEMVLIRACLDYFKNDFFALKRKSPWMHSKVFKSLRLLTVPLADLMPFVSMLHLSQSQMQLLRSNDKNESLKPLADASINLSKEERNSSFRTLVITPRLQCLVPEEVDQLATEKANALDSASDLQFDKFEMSFVAKQPIRVTHLEVSVPDDFGVSRHGFNVLEHYSVRIRVSQENNNEICFEDEAVVPDQPVIGYGEHVMYHMDVMVPEGAMITFEVITKKGLLCRLIEVSTEEIPIDKKSQALDSCQLKQYAIYYESGHLEYSLRATRPSTIFKRAKYKVL